MKRSMLWVLAFAVMTLGACGGGDEAETELETTEVPETVEPTTPAPAPAPMDSAAMPMDSAAAAPTDTAM